MLVKLSAARVLLASCTKEKVTDKKVAQRDGEEGECQGADENEEEKECESKRKQEEHIRM